ncbi:MAG TPA: alpha-amylase family glycosyl hydrolase [Bacteroidales bacterium]|nr:alpha-amylase family glycosyl hydrolase [Bacteroidales bacterium]
MKTLKMNTERIIPILLALLPVMVLLIIAGCSCPVKKEEAVTKEPPQSFVVHPEWSRYATIYEANIRQFTPEGTFQAFTAHIPRLKKMGVDILWLMPIHPIGERGRKGTLGSYYSVKDYKGINPEFGTLEDFKQLVGKAHAEGMKVIIDWVANHTAWDHAWMEEHPEYYTKDSLGKIVSPFDWSDVADLNFDAPGLQDAMIDALKYWVKEADIDGYRCDVAGMVPVEFWDKARAELDAVKPVFMLAEAEEPQHHIRAFNMSYAWELHHILNDIANGKKNANAIEAFYIKNDTLYPRDAYRMLFTSNHDENSWQGTEFERMGPASVCMAVLTATLPGMPLVYSGQESAFNKRLRFFEKDTIDWKDYRLEPFYRKLFALKHAYQPLWNGNWGGKLQRIGTTADSSVFVFMREKEGDRVLILTNLTPEVREFTLIGKAFAGDYKEWFSEEGATFRKGEIVRLKPWEYKIYVKK